MRARLATWTNSLAQSSSNSSSTQTGSRVSAAAKLRIHYFCTLIFRCYVIDELSKHFSTDSLARSLELLITFIDKATNQAPNQPARQPAKIQAFDRWLAAVNVIHMAKQKQSNQQDWDVVPSLHSNSRKEFLFFFSSLPSLFFSAILSSSSSSSFSFF